MLNVYSKDNEVKTTITHGGDYDNRQDDTPMYLVECPTCGADEELVKIDILDSCFNSQAYSKHDFLKYEVDRIHYTCENCGCIFIKTYRHNNTRVGNDKYHDDYKFSWLKAEVTDKLWQIVRLVCYILIAVILVFIGYANDFNGGVALASAIVLGLIIVAFCFEFLLLFME